MSDLYRHRDLSEAPKSAPVPPPPEPAAPEPPAPPRPEVTPPPVSVVPAPPQAAGGNGLDIASLVIGILSIVFLCLFPLNFLLAIPAIVLAALSKSGGKRWTGMAIAGLATGIVSIVLGLLFVVLLFVGLGFLFSLSDVFWDFSGFPTDFRF